KAMWREGPAAGIIERQAKAEGLARLHLTDRLQHTVGRDVVQATELVVLAEIAPVGPFRPLRPPPAHIRRLRENPLSCFSERAAREAPAKHLTRAHRHNSATSTRPAGRICRAIRHSISP